MWPVRPRSNATAPSSARLAGGEPSNPTTMFRNPPGSAAVVTVINLAPDRYGCQETGRSRHPLYDWSQYYYRYLREARGAGRRRAGVRIAGRAVVRPDLRLIGRRQVSRPQAA